jgi:hypothetical protein
VLTVAVADEPFGRPHFPRCLRCWRLLGGCRCHDLLLTRLRIRRGAHQ